MDDSLHKILKRQIRKKLGENFEPSTELKNFFTVVSNTYTHFDEDMALIDHSMDVSSKELLEINKNLKEQQLLSAARTAELERMNNIMIDRELRIVELKNENKKLKEQLGITK